MGGAARLAAERPMAVGCGGSLQPEWAAASVGARRSERWSVGPEDLRSIGPGVGVGGDDAADALRYLVATKAREIRVRKLRGF